MTLEELFATYRAQSGKNWTRRQEQAEEYTRQELTVLPQFTDFGDWLLSLQNIVSALFVLESIEDDQEPFHLRGFWLEALLFEAYGEDGPRELHRAARIYGFAGELVALVVSDDPDALRAMKILHFILNRDDWVLPDLT